ncbi:Nramp family divalent metal transporter [Rhodococcus spongiicola]|uniref:Divalent metal cation transporter n=1 Tax=Rhodococcus spongiicola TaxID=2487352 RepID=A0A438B253_9NOCA|nr:Nramp family divalent metal transporter [Rhodococcus spongiicola]RVW05038.1 divalent metal cation transporter [Rhodococcus spongiicola]
MAGPAFIVGAWQFGPGALASSIQAGSEYGYALVWVLAASAIFSLTYADMSVRLGIRTPVSLISSVKEVLGRGAGVAAGVGVFCITLCFSVGNAVGSGLGLSLVFGGSPLVWSAVCTAAVGMILLFRNVYRMVERIVVTAIAIMAATFAISAVIAKPDWYEAVNSIVPSIPPGAQLLVVAIVGTNFSLNAAFFASYTTHERNRTEAQYREATIVGTIPGIVAPTVMSSLVMIVSAAVLGREGVEATSFAALAKIFEPLAGPVGSTIFAIGLSGAAFSSMVANATGGGIIFSDALGKGPTSSSTIAKLASGAILTVGLTVTLVVQANPIQLIIGAQALTVLVAPFLGFLLFVMSNNRALMGHLRNKPWQNVLGVLGFCAILSVSALFVYQILT